MVTEKGDSTTSFLLVQEAKPSDSGRYTCNPSNAQPKSITVHVLNGEWFRLNYNVPLSPRYLIGGACEPFFFCAGIIARVPEGAGKLMYGQLLRKRETSYRND